MRNFALDISVRSDGDFKNTDRYLKKLLDAVQMDNILDQYGRKGVDALSAATPVLTGLTASSWYYKAYHDDKRAKLTFYNSNVNKGVPIAIILQYGHGTNHGGYVEGRDYINPAIQPIFDDMVEELRREVAKL